MVGPAAKREAVAHLRNRFEMSERRACAMIAADRAMIRYRSIRPDDRALRARLRSLAQKRRRFGCRRLFILLRREGEPYGITRLYRLYREEGLPMRFARQTCCRFASGGLGAKPLAPVPRSWWRPGPTRAGRLILFTTNWTAGGGFGCSTSSRM